jgi:hypothetical protein
VDAVVFFDELWLLSASQCHDQVFILLPEVVTETQDADVCIKVLLKILG